MHSQMTPMNLKGKHLTAWEWNCATLAPSLLFFFFLTQKTKLSSEVAYVLSKTQEFWSHFVRKHISVKSPPYRIPSLALPYSPYLRDCLSCIWLWPKGSCGLWNPRCTRYPLGLIWDLCQGKPSLSHRLHPQSHPHRLTASFFHCSSAPENCSQLIRQ